ncbi:hypothetical protein BJX68DRAFT_240578 [Aspergillus pseudodeflectus]|uniref:Uncharacterized protein n=1 Tax=Aspergillus pseudodeflectus TaxID=176178 RepID=A0ABR4K3D4_9EURO
MRLSMPGPWIANTSGKLISTILLHCSSWTSIKADWIPLGKDTIPLVLMNFCKVCGLAETICNYPNAFIGEQSFQKAAQEELKGLFGRQRIR